MARGGRLIEKMLDWDRRGVKMEALARDSHAEGAHIHAYVTEAARGGDARGDARERGNRARERNFAEMHGGCSA